MTKEYRDEMLSRIDDADIRRGGTMKIKVEMEIDEAAAGNFRAIGGKLLNTRKRSRQMLYVTPSTRALSVAVDGQLVTHRGPA